MIYMSFPIKYGPKSVIQCQASLSALSAISFSSQPFLSEWVPTVLSPCAE